MDAEDYSSYPDSQFEEDNVLRELNKCLLAFRQNTTCPIIPKNAPRINRRMNSLPSIDSSHEAESIKDKERNQAQRRYDAVLRISDNVIAKWKLTFASGAKWIFILGCFFVCVQISSNIQSSILFGIFSLWFVDYRQSERVAVIRQKTSHKSLSDNHQQVQNDPVMIRIALHIISIRDDHGW